MAFAAARADFAGIGRRLAAVGRFLHRPCHSSTRSSGSACWASSSALDPCVRADARELHPGTGPRRPWIRADRRVARCARLPAMVQIIMGVLALHGAAVQLCFDAMAWLLSALARDEDGYVLFNIGSSILALALMLPATFMAGMTLPLITFCCCTDGWANAVSALSTRRIRSDRSAASCSQSISASAAGAQGKPRRRRGDRCSPWRSADLGSHAAPAAMGIRLRCAGGRGGHDHRRALVRDRSDADRVQRVSNVVPTISVNARDSVPSGWQDVDGRRCRVRRREDRDSTNGKPDASIQKDFGTKPPTLDEYTMVLAAAPPLAYRSNLEKAA